MRRIATATVAAILILVGSVGVVAADAPSAGQGTFQITQDPPTVVRPLGNLTYLRWSEVIDFDGTLEGSALCTVHALQRATRIDFVSWCQYNGTVGDSEIGTAAGPAVGRVTFSEDGPSAQVRFVLGGGSGGLAGLHLTGEALASGFPPAGTYSVSYGIAGR